MNAELAFANDLDDLVEPVLTSVVHFQSRTRRKTAVINCKDNGTKDRLITAIKRAIDEYAYINAGANAAYLPRRAITASTAAAISLRDMLGLTELVWMTPIPFSARTAK